MHARSTVTLARTGAAKRTSVRKASDHAKTLIGFTAKLIDRKLKISVTEATTQTCLTEVDTSL